MEKTFSAFIAIVGRPNVGKSSLLNRFVGEKVAIVSPKPQTTRTRITGVLTESETQFVFIDTPGLHNPRTKLSEFMVKQIKDSVVDVDAAVLVTEPLGKIHPMELELLQRFRDLRIPAILAINKIDTIPKKDVMMEKISAFSALFPFEAVVPVSALTGDGMPQLLEELSHYAKEGPHYFPDDAMTDQPERVIVAEIIREKLLNCL
ncbi:MAG: GTPase Era, partial [Oscillospiraceae bacterium]